MDNFSLLLMLKAFLINTPDMVFVKDTTLTYIAASDSFAKMVGRKSGDELVGKTDFDIFHLELAEKYINDDKLILEQQGKIVDYIEPLPEVDGKKKYSSTSKYTIFDDSGSVIGIYGVAKDVTAQVELEAVLESNNLSRQMFDDVFEADLTQNRLLTTDGSKLFSGLSSINDASFTETVQLLSEKLVHNEYSDEFLSCYSLDKLVSDYKKGIHDFTHVTCMRVNLQSSDYRWVTCQTRVYHSRISDTLRITVFLRDIDDEVKSKKQLEKDASTDKLTGLSNRFSVFEKINACLSNPENKNKKHALLFIDLDRFKQVNDRWGHKFGDKVLIETANRLSHILGEDIALGRIGGDEFIAFIDDASSESDIEEIGKKIIEKFPFNYYKSHEEISITCSVGIAVCDHDEATLDQLCEKADDAMYKVKKHGRNDYIII